MISDSLCYVANPLGCSNSYGSSHVGHVLCNVARLERCSKESEVNERPGGAAEGERLCLVSGAAESSIACHSQRAGVFEGCSCLEE